MKAAKKNGGYASLSNNQWRKHLARLAKSIGSVISNA